jgi:hypothetical protein
MDGSLHTRTQKHVPFHSSRWIFAAAVLLFAAFFIATYDLTRDSLWNDEGWTAWAVQPPYLADMLARIRADVHPPLYFLLLDGWVRVVGDSVYTLRLLSTFLGLIGLAATYAVGKRLMDRATGFMALVILGTASFFVYYTREARMYTLLLALSALATWIYLLWRSRPTWLRTLAYGLLMAGLMYTHYSGALVIFTHLIHLLLTTLFEKRNRPSIAALWRMPIPYALAFVFYLPWLPIFLNQMRANPNGPLAIPVPTDWATVAGLVLILVGGSWWVYVLPFLLGRAIPRLRQYGSAVLLLVLWLLLTPIILLALNAWVAPVYQVRYAIAMLPAGALLIAYGLRWASLPVALLRLIHAQNVVRFIQVGLPIVLLAALAQAQLTIYPELWPEKPPWDSTIRAMTSDRDPLDPTITDIAAYSPVAYYDRLLRIRQGVSLDLSWRLHHYDEIMNLVDLFKDAPSVWVALPVNTAKTWHIIAALDEGRQASYRSSLVNMIFYRFDQGEAGDLQFRFGDVLRYESGVSAAERFSLAPGETLCVDLDLRVLATLDDRYSAGLHLVDITGTTVVAQWDEGLGSPTVGDELNLKPCIDIPADVPVGYYHLELVVYQWSNLERLRLFEDSGNPLPWGDVLMLAAVDVSG